MTVLLVDDDADELFLFEEALREADSNIKLITSNGGESCSDKLKNTIPDFIFLDVNMPKVNGRDYLKAIKNTHNLSNVPVIIYSTSISPADKEFFEKSGAELVTKPSSFSELVTFVKQLFVKHKL